jgi:hypothetical protein
MVIIKFNYTFIYVLSSSASGQLHNQHEYIQQQYDSTEWYKNKEQKKQKWISLGFLHSKKELIKIYASLHNNSEIHSRRQNSLQPPLWEPQILHNRFLSRLII